MRSELWIEAKGCGNVTLRKIVVLGRGLCLWLLAWMGLVLISTGTAQADGCFVFRWNKDIDIKEPTQKAIIVFDGGREELLLQVKYEGPLEEFGWLIPVPSLPEVEKGSMEPFYELSRITQRDVHSDFRMMMRGGVTAGDAESVKALEVKTVGAYQVAVLSAKESGSLAAWLQSHDYSIPQDQSGVVEEYIRKGWYFVAVKIQLNKGDTFERVSASREAQGPPSRQALRQISQQLAEGELHPLLIGFDTAKCVFPLTISAVGGKPSEVSLYVLSTSPLLENSLYQEALDRYHQKIRDWEHGLSNANERAKAAWANREAWAWGRTLERFAPGVLKTGNGKRAWTTKEVVAMCEEEWPFRARDTLGTGLLDDNFNYAWFQLLHCRPISSQEMPQCMRQFARLTNASWYVTKQGRTFQPEEMRDLYFEPAIPILARLLREPRGAVGLLTGLRPASNSALELARNSTNSLERVNALKAMFWPKDSRYVETILEFLRDPSPGIRYEALKQLGARWDAQFGDALVPLLQDDYPEIRGNAAALLRKFDSGAHTSPHLELFGVTDPVKRSIALAALPEKTPPSVAREEFVERFKALDLADKALALSALSETNAALIPREEFVGLLSVPRFEIAYRALYYLSPKPPGEQTLPSEEAARLATNQLARLRLIGLSLLGANGDATAVEIAVSLTKDPNAIVGRCAFELLRHVTGKSLSITDPAEWERWWLANKATFVPKKEPGG